MSNKPGYSLTHEDMEKLWKSSSDEGKYYLFSTFGVKEETFLSDIRDRVTDFDSAEIELKRRYNTRYIPYSAKVNAFTRLTVVANALNEGCPEEEKDWLPLFDSNGKFLVLINVARLGVVKFDSKILCRELSLLKLAYMQLRLARPLMVRSEILAMYFAKQFASDWKILYS